MQNPQIAKFRAKADRIIASVQRRIDTKGAYENAGQKEARKFQDEVTSALPYSDVWPLIEYLDRRIDNLRY